MNRLNKTESAVFLYCRFSQFLKYPFSRLFAGHNIAIETATVITKVFKFTWSFIADSMYKYRELINFK